MILWYKIKVPFFEWKEERWVKKRFYKDPFFAQLDQELLSGENPYREAAVFPYGETPLRTFYAVGQAMQLQPDDVFVDLGCGRGRGCFFLSHVFGCRSIGVDLTPSFIERAKFLAAKHSIERVRFEMRDFLSVDFRSVTCVYLYGTTYSEECLEALTEKLIDLPQKARIAVVSEPLRGWECRAKFTASFPWGRGEVFLHDIEKNKSLL